MNIHGLICKLVERKGRKAEIEIEGQIITVSSDFLPRSLEGGNSFKIYFLDTEESQTQEKKIAKLILEEILNGK